MKTHQFLLLLTTTLAALASVSVARAELTNLTVALEAQTRGGTFADADIDEVAAGYLFVKYNAPSLDTSRKVYLQFDLTDAGPDTVNQPATLTIRGFANSQRQRVKLWGLNQAYPGLSSTITWNSAQANDTTGNDLLTEPTNPFTATVLDEKVAAGGSAAVNTFTIPQPWGQYLLAGKLVLVLTGASDPTNQANGLRFARADATLTFNNTVGNQLVAINGLTNQTLYAGESATNHFTVSDDNTAPGDIFVWADSSNENLVSASSFNFTGYGVSGLRTLEYAATAGQSGTAVITLNAMDNLGALTTAPFTVTVLPPLTLTTPPHLATQMNTPTPPAGFTVNSVLAPASTITVSGASAHPALVADSGIALSGTDTAREVVVTPVNGQTGVAPITLTADDGAGNQGTAQFAVMVLPDTRTVFCDHFDYPDGFLTPLSANFWALRTSGTTRLTVTNQAAVLRSSGGSWESQLAPLAGGPYPAGSRSVFYLQCQATWTVLPRNSTGPFLHLNDTAGSLLGKLRTITNNLPDGFFRLGIASGPGSLYRDLPVDLTTNVTYHLVGRYDPDVGLSALWVNATSETDPHITATDTPVSASLASVGLRQQAGIGTLTMDDVKVIRVVRPEVTGITVAGTQVEIAFAADAADQPDNFALVRTTDISGPYTTASATITESAPGFFRAVVLVSGSQGFFQVLRQPLTF
jgi:hypothetical protein